MGGNLEGHPGTAIGKHCEVARGDIGAQFLKTAYTFRRFTHNYLLSLHHSFKGEDGKLALDVLARSLTYVVLLAGVPAILFLDDLLDELEKFFGKPFRSEMRKALRDAGGPVLERMGMAGIPALMGIDISGSLKTGIPLVGKGLPAIPSTGSMEGFSVRV